MVRGAGGAGRGGRRALAHAILICVHGLLVSAQGRGAHAWLHGAANPTQLADVLSALAFGGHWSSVVGLALRRIGARHARGRGLAGGALAAHFGCDGRGRGLADAGLGGGAGATVRRRETAGGQGGQVHKSGATVRAGARLNLDALYSGHGIFVFEYHVRVCLDHEVAGVAEL